MKLPVLADNGSIRRHPGARLKPLPELTAFLEGLPEPHILFDAQYRILAANAAYRRQYSPDRSVVGRCCYEVSHHFAVPCDQAGESCPLAQSRVSGQRERVLHLHHTAQGEEYVNIELSPLPGPDGEPAFYVEKMEPLRVAQSQPAAQGMIGRSEAFQRMLSLVARVAPSRATVLLLGESGTGMELVARAVHEASPRHDAAMVTVNCPSLSTELLALSERLSERLKAKAIVGDTVTLKLKSAGFRLRTRARHLMIPTQLASVLYETSLQLLAREVDGTAFRLIGIGVSGLSAAQDGDPVDLLEPQIARRAAAERAMDRVRNRFGQDAVIRGKSAYKTLLIVVYAIAPPVAGLIGMMLFDQHIGPFVKFAALFGWEMKVGLNYFDTAFAMARIARVGNDLALAMATRAGLLHREEALLHAHLTDATAGRAGRWRRAFLRAGTIARLAVDQCRNADIHRRAAHRFFQIQLQGVAQVAATLSAATGTAATATEEITEDITKDVREVLTAETGATPTHARVDAGMAVLIVRRTLARVGQHFIGLVGLFEHFFRRFVIGITVRVVLHRQTTVSLLEVRIA